MKTVRLEDYRDFLQEGLFFYPSLALQLINAKSLIQSARYPIMVVLSGGPDRAAGFVEASNTNNTIYLAAETLAQMRETVFHVLHHEENHNKSEIYGMNPLYHISHTLHSVLQSTLGMPRNHVVLLEGFNEWLTLVQNGYELSVYREEVLLAQKWQAFCLEHTGKSLLMEYGRGSEEMFWNIVEESLIAYEISLDEEQSEAAMVA